MPRTPSHSERSAGKGRTVVTRLSWLVLAVILAGLFFLGWRWVKEIPFRSLDVVSGPEAPSEEVAQMARVEPSGYLYDVDADSVRDRVGRHPWVRHVSVKRIPTGVLRLTVETREPVLLALDAEGRPAFYLDADGFRLPMRPGVAHLVPLIRGVSRRYFKQDSLLSTPVRQLAAALPQTGQLAGALLSEFELLSGPKGIRLHTVPYGASGSIPVELGHGDYGAKLDRLAAFWEQAVLPRPTTAYESIDLRFDSQIVVRSRPGASVSHSR